MVQRTWRKPGPWADPRILAVPEKTAAGEGRAQWRWRRRDKLCQLAGRAGVLWGPAPVRERGGGGAAGAEGDVARRRIHNRGISQRGREQSTRPGHAEAGQSAPVGSAPRPRPFSRFSSNQSGSDVCPRHWRTGVHGRAPAVVEVLGVTSTDAPVFQISSRFSRYIDILKSLCK